MSPSPALVVGLGPGPDSWMTPEVAAVLAEIDHVVGYGPYLDRLPPDRTCGGILRATLSKWNGARRS